MLSGDCVLQLLCVLTIEILNLTSKHCIYYPPRFSRGQCDVFRTTTLGYTDHTEVEEVVNITIPLRAHVQVCSFDEFGSKGLLPKRTNFKSSSRHGTTTEFQVQTISAVMMEMFN